jgi:putative heme transporter
VDRTQRGHATKWRFAALVVGAIALSAQWRTFVTALGRFGQLRPAWLATAFAAEVASVILAAELQHQLLRSAGVRVGRGFLVALTYAGAAVSRSLPAGAAVSVGYA